VHGRERRKGVMMAGSTNPLVADRVDTTSPFAGAGVLEDGYDLVTAIQDESWVDGALAGASLVMDTVAAVSDPLGTLIGAGLGWLIDHLSPLNEWLEDLTGDADQVRAFAQTWANVAGQLDESGGELSRKVAADLEELSGAAAQAYRAYAGDMAAHLHGAGQWAQGVSTGLSIAAEIVQVVHDLVRDTLADLVGSIISWMAEAALSFGLATPWVIEQVATRVASLTTRLGTSITGLLRSLKNLGGLLDSLKTLLRRAKKIFDDLLHGGTPRTPDAPTPSHAPDTPAPTPKPADPTPTPSPAPGGGPSGGGGSGGGSSGGGSSGGGPSGGGSGGGSGGHADGSDGDSPGGSDPDGDGASDGSASSDAASVDVSRLYDPDAPVPETVSARDAPRGYTQEDVDQAWDDAPVNEEGQKVDPRTGEPLAETRSDGQRGWHMRWDPENEKWVAERPGSGYPDPDGLPETGEPGSYGYDSDGKLMPYANHRPDYASDQVEAVWAAAEKHGDGDDVYVLVKDMEDNDVQVRWNPGEPRDDLWHMGHRHGMEYRNLLDRYLSHQIDLDEFLTEYRKPENYEVQHPGRNMSHMDEAQ
jgi:hypothetical protein